MTDEQKIEIMNKLVDVCREYFGLEEKVNQLKKEIVSMTKQIGEEKESEIEVVKIISHVDGVPHHERLPAIVHADGTREWYLNGLRHREDGPAIEYADGTMEWWINGKQVNK